MGGVSSLARLLWKVPLVAMTATAALTVSATAVHLQDVADYEGAVVDGPRWAAFVPGPPNKSEFEPTFRFGDAGPVSGGLLAAADEPLTTGSVGDEPFDATAQRVNRAAKGDLMISRPPQTAPDYRLPTSGAVWKLEDIFSAHEDSELPKVALVPANRSRLGDIMLAHESFIKTDGLASRANIMMAKAEPVRSPLRPVQKGEAATVVAYAPAAADHDAPFDALLSMSGNQTLAPVLPPRGRPDVEVARFMTGHGPQRRRPGDHEWAGNPLPANVYKESQQSCLARGIYFEARGETVRGQAAVAQVILNRVKNPAYPKTICGVVYQNKKWRNRCQFSFACDGKRDRIYSTKHYKTAQYVAREVTDGNIWLPEVGDATHYHATYVHPRWARKLKKTDRIGRHIFYRTKNGGWS
jgi:hypothetical protein